MRDNETEWFFLQEEQAVERINLRKMGTMSNFQNRGELLFGLEGTVLW
jgi:hypothetical protein